MSELSKVNLGLCGLGTVGSGVFNVLERNASLIASRAGMTLDIAHIGARRDNPNCELIGKQVSRDVFAVVNDPNIDIVVELIGGTTTAKDLVLQAIENGKHVVTANKALIASHGDEILGAAAEKNVAVRFEAAVAGGIPVIKALQEGLSANRIESIAGIINGTGNYILTEMRDKGRSFEDALADAQALGYAEADPTFDVEGIDAAQKLVILAALAYGTTFDADSCYNEGISEIKVEDIRYAEAMGYRIKHLGIARKTDVDLELRVHPCLVPEQELIANVDGVMNAVSVKGDAVGPTLYFGAGAGAEPTASAVIADIVDAARMLSQGAQRFCRVVQREAAKVRSMDAVETAWYLRAPVQDKPGVLSEVTQTLSDENISVQTMRQPDAQQGRTEIIMITDIVAESALKAALEKLASMDSVSGKIAAIRVENKI